MSSNEIKVLGVFKKQLVAFCGELIFQFPREADFVMLKLFIENQIPIKDLIEIFNLHINKNDHQVKRMIEGRNDDFFIKHNPFAVMTKSKVDHLAELWTDDSMTQDTKDVMWRWIDMLVMIGDKYQVNR